MSSPHGVALITGGGRGLGRAFAIALAENGFKVAVTARTEAEINQTAQAIVRAGGRAIAIPGDVTDRRAVEHTVARTEAELGSIDLLINNAGELRALGVVGAIDPDAWWREIEINVRGPFLFTNIVLPRMLAHGRGRIINLASGAGLGPIETASAYCVSKAALIRFTENLALEMRTKGVAVFALDPGTVRTPMNEHFMQSETIRHASPDVAAWFDQLFAEGQDTPIEQSVQLVLALASGRADALSGCFVSVQNALDALIAQAEEIQRKERLRLRLAE